MVKLFLDIETIPCEEGRKNEIEAVVRKKLKSGEEDEDWYHKTGLDGAYGRICCIGYIKEDGKVTRGVLTGDEKKIVADFWQLAADVSRFVGHNIWAFDLPFIYQRSYILGVRPRTDINFARYKSTPIFDTMCEWTLWNLENEKKKKLEALAVALNLPNSKDKMDGGEVWSYYQAGKMKEICEYCMKDVELVRQVYYRMTFEEQPPEAMV